MDFLTEACLGSLIIRNERVMDLVAKQVVNAVLT